MKQLALLLLFSGTMVAAPPILEDWGLPQPEAIRIGETPTQTKDPNAEAEKVHSVSTEAIKNKVTAGCIEQTCIMLNGDLDKHERDAARWRLSNLKNHPYYDPAAYDSRGAGRFPHSGNDTY